jgi:hypothetical protein
MAPRSTLTARQNRREVHHKREGTVSGLGDEGQIALCLAVARLPPLRSGHPVALYAVPQGAGVWAGFRRSTR